MSEKQGSGGKVATAKRNQRVGRVRVTDIAMSALQNADFYGVLAFVLSETEMARINNLREN